MLGKKTVNENMVGTGENMRICCNRLNRAQGGLKMGPN